MKAAVIQAASIPFDSKAATEKAIKLIHECGVAGAKLAVFPEAFIGGYPKGSSFGSVVGQRNIEGRELFSRYVAAAIELDGEEITLLETAAAESGIFVVVGVIEKLGNTLYCTALLIDSKKGLVGKHRKLMPTASERVIWGFGDGSTLDVVDSPGGKLGAVICWENYMPLLRQTMYAKGIEVYCAPTADDRPTWPGTMTHIALEGRVHVLTACQSITKAEYPADYGFDVNISDQVMRGGSMIIDPLGNVLAGPVYDEEVILYANLDLDIKTQGHLDFDAAGNYSRPDIFRLNVNERPLNSVEFGQQNGFPAA